MVTLTAILKVAPENADTIEAAFLEVVSHVSANEPETLGYYVARSTQASGTFTTYERYADNAAMDRHNKSGAVARFFELVAPLLVEPAMIVIAEEIATKAPE